jgi:hypothetical protein
MKGIGGNQEPEFIPLRTRLQRIRELEVRRKAFLTPVPSGH